MAIYHLNVRGCSPATGAGAAKTACDRLVDRYAVNLPDGGDLNDGSTASPATQTAQPARTQDRSIELFGGTRER